jgi:hypothetical protein
MLGQNNPGANFCRGTAEALGEPAVRVFRIAGLLPRLEEEEEEREELLELYERTGNEHKFKQDSGMTFEEVYQFALGDYFIPFIKNLAGELDREDFVELVQKTASDSAAVQGKELAESLPSNDFEAWTAWTEEFTEHWKNALTTEIVENTDTALKIKVTECLWAKTFREADGADIGYAMHCHTDYAMCQAFNPKIRMIRTKTLMQGDEYCDHRWVWEE